MDPEYLGYDQFSFVVPDHEIAKAGLDLVRDLHIHPSNYLFC
jgi:hypothetical protein